MFKVIFAFVHNAGRSQMAAAFFNQLAPEMKHIDGSVSVRQVAGLCNIHIPAACGD
jgi:protein-tyrosine-phosphatase